MPNRFVCPSCGASGRLPDGFQGDRIKCPACKTVSPLNAGGTAASAPANPPSSGGPGGAARVEALETIPLVEWESADEPPTVPVAANRPKPTARPSGSSARPLKRVEPDDEDDEDEET